MDARGTKLVAAVRAHALEHYNDDKGWDTVIECMDAGDILAIVYNAKNEATAIRIMGRHLKPGADYARDIRATAF